MSRARAFLFGLNYESHPSIALQGCINDVKNMAAFLQKELKMPCEVITDDVNKKDTTCAGMMNKLYYIAATSWRENLDFVWIHYSGHGSYSVDRNGDEKDGRDECLVPIDVNFAGMIPDDCIKNVFSNMNPKTRVVFVCDSCHSGTMGDLKFSWVSPKLFTVENNRVGDEVRARVITLSGCMDDELAADAYNVDGDRKFTGAMTSCLLMALRSSDKAVRTNVFSLLDAVRRNLVASGFTQKPKLCSSHNLQRDAMFLPQTI